MRHLAELDELLHHVLLARDVVASLYKVCDLASIATGARNSMIAHYSESKGYMTLRAGIGADWRPEMLGERINVGVDVEEGISAYVAATGESFVSGDVTNEPRYRLLIEGSRSELASPIFDRYNRVRGVLNLESPDLNHFSEDQIRWAELLAQVASIALEIEDSELREDALLKVGTALDVAQTEEELLKSVEEVTDAVMRVTAYSIFLWDEQEQAFVLRDTVGKSALSRDARYKPGEGCTGWVCQHGEPILLDDPQTDPRWKGKHLEIAAESIHSYICVPIKSGGRILGAMRAIRKKGKNPYIDVRFTERELRLLSAIAEQLGTGLEKIRSLKKLITSERMAAWGELSARSSHMIGNRVFAIAGDANELRYMLNEEPFPKQRALELLDHMQDSIRKLESILQDYRDFVTATKLHFATNNLATVVREAATSVLPDGGPIKVVFEELDALPEFRFDTQKVERAVSELVENATHYMSAGVVTTRVGLSTVEDLAAANIKPRGLKYAKIEVEDQGPGVPSEFKQKIFDAYYSSRAKGMGLGLSIVKGIVDAHEGYIFENGVSGKGAKFVILLPMRTNGAET